MVKPPHEGHSSEAPIHAAHPKVLCGNMLQLVCTLLRECESTQTAVVLVEGCCRLSSRVLLSGSLSPATVWVSLPSQHTSQMLEKEAMYSACFCTSRLLRGPSSAGVRACLVAMLLPDAARVLGCTGITLGFEGCSSFGSDHQVQQERERLHSQSS